MTNKILSSGFLLLFLLTACTEPRRFVTPVPSFTPAVIESTATSTPHPTNSPTITASPTLTQEPATGVCSPLIGIGLEELKQITSNPYTSPPPYSQDGHPALDFSFYSFKDFTSFQNFPLQAILPGKVVLVENDRFPYGYMLLVETSLSQIDPAFLPSFPQPTPFPPSIYSTDDRCPVTGVPVTWDDTQKSIYVLYAHMAQLPEVSLGDDVSCGQPIGFAGTTGNSVEDHLHLEMRIGPSSAKFSSIASQHSSITLEERYNYCIWSTSGLFQSFDPSALLYP